METVTVLNTNIMNTEVVGSGESTTNTVCPDGWIGTYSFSCSENGSGDLITTINGACTPGIKALC